MKEGVSTLQKTRNDNIDDNMSYDVFTKIVKVNLGSIKQEAMITLIMPRS